MDDSLRLETVEKTVLFVKKELSGAEGGHDWEHTYRVWRNACSIAKEEEADLFVVELGALLHDIADPKFHDGDENIGPEKAGGFLRSLALDDDIIEKVKAIVLHVSFKGGNYKSGYNSRELDVVRDADRLDAIGAIGIARAFNYGGFKNRSMYDPEMPPRLNMGPKEYRANTGPTINHFYEKLLRLKDMMNTNTGKRMAEERHRFMEGFVERFIDEWEGRK